MWEIVRKGSLFRFKKYNITKIVGRKKSSPAVTATIVSNSKHKHSQTNREKEEIKDRLNDYLKRKKLITYNRIPKKCRFSTRMLDKFAVFLLDSQNNTIFIIDVHDFRGLDAATLEYFTFRNHIARQENIEFMISHG
ncbi:hypothetical protein OTU49_012218 [Cherax quadricarinatus]|uniref:Uncharacterized protein n=1 Tax=Cherax quadricarinatus TaxID=27406 RepID=A0AAW0VYE3_CHEQU